MRLSIETGCGSIETFSWRLLGSRKDWESRRLLRYFKLSEIF